ncbi:MAG: class I SAM-dependent DNA methyltransferase [Candidatus Paceibacterota bacterium]
MSDIQNIVKNIQNIMRKDEGVDGDAQRLSQLVWMLFLKIFDDKERELELIDEDYTSPIPEEYRWRNWAADPEGMTGEELFEFVDNDLFPALKELEVFDTDSNAQIVKNVFTDTYNYMKNGTLIRQVVNKINDVNFNKTDDRHQFGDVYEKLLKDLQSAGNAGEYYTPRPLTRFVVEMVDPKLGDKVLDPACGTGGFLVDTLTHVRENDVKTKKDEELLESSVRGVELKPLPHLLATTNFMLHDVENPHTIERGDMLSRPLTEYKPSDRVDVIVANPPFGGSVADGTEKNFPSKFRTRETADLFLVLFIHLLKDGGRAGIVLPDGTLFGEGVKTEIKKHLLESCNLHTIIRLPSGVFNPYAGVNTNLLFFTKGGPTKKIWYYHMPLPDHLKNGYTKTKPIKSSEFEPIKEWWNDREENEFAHKVSIDEVIEKNYNLDFKNQNNGESVITLSSTQITNIIEEKEEEILKLINNLL